MGFARGIFMVATGFRVSMATWRRFLTVEGETGMTATESKMAKRTMIHHQNN
jgi:hypothetical protein